MYSDVRSVSLGMIAISEIRLGDCTFARTRVLLRARNRASNNNNEGGGKNANKQEESDGIGRKIINRRASRGAIVPG